MKKKASYPTKRSMNLYYKPDRTTKPSTTALYILFAVAVLLGLAKLLVYDLWMENQQAQREMIAAQNELSDAMREIADFDEVQQRYIRYSATDEELTIVDRIDVLDMLESATRGANMSSVSISGDRVQLHLIDVTLSQTADIVKNLEDSPIVASTVVSTASSTDNARDTTQTSIVIQLQKEAD